MSEKNINLALVVSFSVMSKKSGVEDITVDTVEKTSTNNPDPKKPIGIRSKVSTRTVTIPANPKDKKVLGMCC